MMSETTDTLTELEGKEIKNSERGVSYGVLVKYSERRDAVKMRDVSGTERWQSADNIRTKLDVDGVEVMDGGSDE